MPVTGFSEIGDHLTEALVSGRFDLYQRVMDLPVTIVPAGEAAYVLATEAELQRDFELYHNVLNSTASPTSSARCAACLTKAMAFTASCAGCISWRARTGLQSRFCRKC